MYRLLEFIRSIYITLIFIALESTAIYIYVTSDSYAQAKLLTYSAGLISTVDNVTSSVKDYFTLRQQNRELIARITDLEKMVAGHNIQQQDSMLTALGYINDGRKYTAAHVVSNRVNKRDNYLVVNRGLQHGIRAGMAVITLHDEMVGVVMECSDRYSIIMSVLHSKFNTSGMIEGYPNIASIRWGGVDPRHMTMSDLSRYVPVEIGAKVTTTGYSQIFPEGVTIGTISRFQLDREQSSITADVELSVDMRSVRNILIVHDVSIDEANSVINNFFENEQ